MSAVANGMLSNNITEEILLLNRALEVLTWGRKEWKDVSPADRGVIFEITFVNGVRSLLVQAMQEVKSNTRHNFLIISSHFIVSLSGSSSRKNPS